tara:strand:- start:107 stop:364 length:258 start_codon:yes stop_codon:yes gene_type:complete
MKEIIDNVSSTETMTDTLSDLDLFEDIDLIIYESEIKREVKNMKQYATWELKNMIKALSIMPVLNTDEENKRLEKAKQELKLRRE